MQRVIASSLITLGSIAFVAGCTSNKRDDQLHGTSTRRAEAQPAQPAQPAQAAQPVQPAQPAQPAARANYTSYGEPMKLTDAQAVPVGKVLENPAAHEGKYVRLVGNVNQVCARKGCWLEMTDEQSGKPLFVKFTCPVEGRLIPMEATGKPVVVEGTVMVKEISEGEARHFKQDAGATAEEIAKIVGPQKQVTLASPAARVAGL